MSRSSSSSSNAEQRLLKLAEQLNKEALDNPKADADTCLDLVQALHKETVHVSLAVLENTKIGKCLTRVRRSFQRYKRTDNDGDWGEIIERLNKVIDEWKKIADEEEEGLKKDIKTAESVKNIGRPQTVAQYKARLLAQKKDMYKDPPVLPPCDITVETEKVTVPNRCEDTGSLSFTAKNPAVKSLLKDFHPNRTPEEVLRAGSFGGTYFRSIVSAVTNQSYKGADVLKDTVPSEWVEGLTTGMLTSQAYRPAVNKYGVKCGGSLGMWESSGWIVDVDPYGWFQWYCRFYQGRRCSDDDRQISRWLKSAGPKGRFRSQLCNKIVSNGTTFDDKSVSPVIRQTLLHWGLEITSDILKQHVKRVGK
mmetsp:Transcript_7551/g.9874  ORF Transcript_7551/g.9874 Transcript_7551/m.9874 type:complete len:364 (+) Transcript_7551:246-1337(+)|eukprot:CAMPEP_0198147244 /NCGR_PEP_ID=MMETSP1443-20131203/34111_1 /TAXON_ID=186043 /ORGANISM="Entomoneis sp., Strain CCMP2396" /LENGTH=363 /DNA_ID=CAMNT_0043811477 /DNA_START=224 /DNA_END=1315 /DNA_ORIENTATION=-